MSLYLGIDFGTSTIYVTKWDEAKKEAIPVANLTPFGTNNFIESAIYYQSVTDMVVGKTAIERGTNSPFNLVKNVKRKIEDDHWTERIESLDKELNAVDISTDIFRYLKQKVEQNHAGTAIDGVVISVPFAFQNKERQKIKKAAENAGLNVLKLIEEPVAAAISFGLFHESIKDNLREKILIFDLGGGTFDVTIFELVKNTNNNIRIEVLNTDGHKDLGGRDIDDLIVNKFEEILDYRISDIENPKQKLKDEVNLAEAAKEVKEKLSEVDDTDVFLTNLYQGKTLDIEEITVEQFNNWLTKNGFLGKIRTVLESALDEIYLDPEDIDRIVLVGGSSNIPIIQDLVEDFFGKKAEAVKNTGELVGEGAGIYCGSLLDKSLNYEIIPKISHAIGVKVQGGKFERLISRNNKYEEFSATRYFKVSSTSETATKIEIYQGNSPDIQRCSYVGPIIIKGQNLPEEQIGIQLGTDKNGIVKYKLYDVNNTLIQEGEV